VRNARTTCRERKAVIQRIFSKPPIVIFYCQTVSNPRSAHAPVPQFRHRCAQSSTDDVGRNSEFIPACVRKQNSNP